MSYLSLVGLCLCSILWLFRWSVGLYCGWSVILSVTCLSFDKSVCYFTAGRLFWLLFVIAVFVCLYFVIGCLICMSLLWWSVCYNNSPRQTLEKSNVSLFLSFLYTLKTHNSFFIYLQAQLWLWFEILMKRISVF